MFVLLSVVLMSLPQSVCAQIQQIGFFLGGSAAALMMNGMGEMADEDFEVTDDFFEMTVDEDYWGLSIIWDNYSGWGWENKLLYGFKSLVGYRFSPQFAIMGSYSYYLEKNGEQTDSYNSLYYDTDLRFTKNSDNEYSQSVVQILGQFHPTKGQGFFLAAGIEFVSMKAELSDEFIVEDWYGTDSYPWKAKGKDKATGFVLGGGIEVPLSSQNMSFIATGLYSLTKYDGDDLLEVKTSSGSVSDPNIDIELGVGGFMGSIGLIMYFDSSN